MDKTHDTGERRKENAIYVFMLRFSWYEENIKINERYCAMYSVTHSQHRKKCYAMKQENFYEILKKDASDPFI